MRAPPPADCTKKRCAHKIILGKHFSFAEWLDFVREEAEERACRPVADAGNCMVCQETVPGKRAGKPRDHGITIYLMIVRNIHLAK